MSPPTPPGRRGSPKIGQTVGLSPLVTLLWVAVVGVLFGGLAVILAVPFTSAFATLIDVLVPRPRPARRAASPPTSGSVARDEYGRASHGEKLRPCPALRGVSAG